ncbi:MAG: HlyC/CorC family transporter [Firmicutes bacterium]|nr:HlyC/CorC family transporter [Bacillota bacterium]
MIGAVILQIVLIALNAVFASAELAVISMSDAKLERMADKGDKRAKKLVELTAQPARFLATIQVSITLAGFLGSAFAADNFAGPLVQLLLNLGVDVPESVLNTVCVFIITLVIAYFSIVFGELIPKRIAMNRTEGIAMGVSGPLYIVAKVFRPLVWLLTASTNGVLRLIGINPNEDETVTEEEIRMMVSVGSEKGVIDQDENEMIQNVLDFNDVYVEEICTHRKDVVSLDMDDTIEEWRRTIRESRHNYMPVYGEDTDDIVGVLDTRAFLRMDGGPDQLTQEDVLTQCLRKAYFVPENMKADTLCKNMKTTGVHFAVAIDEYGGMSGIVTMHDLIELIIGELFEEGQDPEPDDIEVLEDNCWRIQGSADLEDVAEVLELGLPVDEYDTFGGYVFGVLGRIPDEGAAFFMETEDLDIKVENVQAHRMTSAIVSKKKPEVSRAEI